MIRQLVLLAMLAVTLHARAQISVTDDTGNTLRLQTPATRIVALSPHLAETLYAAGAGGRVVGAVSFSDYPEGAKAIRRVGDAGRIDLEAVAALKPDLILAWQSGNPAAQVARLKSLGFPVFVVEPQRVEDVASQIERIGVLTGIRAAEASAAAYRERLASLARAQIGKPPVTVFYQIWHSPLITVGGPQIISDLIRLCGGSNIFSSLATVAPVVTVEAVLAADPEVIIASGSNSGHPAWLADWRRWPRLTAVKRDNLRAIDPDLVQRHTPRLLDGAEQLCKILDDARAKRSGF
jgi:iron complex transport system substrate-binding protein